MQQHSMGSTRKEKKVFSIELFSLFRKPRVVHMGGKYLTGNTRLYLIKLQMLWYRKDKRIQAKESL